MITTDERVDQYIDKSQEFAEPILRHLRSVVHKACREATETMKWGVPHFEYRGKILCNMASFKQHCAFGFRLGSAMSDPEGVLKPVGTNSGMGHLGTISDLKDLPPDKILIQYIHEAMALTEQGVAKAKRPITARKELHVPDYFVKVLKKDKVAYSCFENFSYSHKKEYVEWITGAKTEETRNKRMATAVEWLREGKGRNWKYVKGGSST